MSHPKTNGSSKTGPVSSKQAKRKDLPPPLSAYQTDTFPYFTVKDRLPVILTQVVDTFHREWKKFLKHEPTKEEADRAKDILAKLSKLKYLMQTDKPLEPFDNMSPEDQKHWSWITDKEHLWFSAPWIKVECYLYNRIHDFFLVDATYSQYDPFRSSKKNAFTDNIPMIKSTLEARQLESNKNNLTFYLDLALWGNRCDLSFTPSTSVKEQAVCSKDKFILVDDRQKFLKQVERMKESKEELTMDYVLDNSGFELFADFCLLDYLTREIKSLKKVRIHVKSIPWFVSDVMKYDFNWTLDQMKPLRGCLTDRCKSFVDKKKWSIEENPFWTYHYGFSEMEKEAPDLYKSLCQSSLIIFKGDLNYRKLLGDLDWPHATPFTDALNGFTPSFLMALRTNKANLISGLDPEKEKTLPSPQFMVDGNYAVIQVSEKNNLLTK